MDKAAQRVVLTGFMGVGKSTVARHLSFLTRKKRVDLDELIERSQKRSIPEIIESDGVEGFRELETLHLQKVLASDEVAIISLGGGAWTGETNRALVKRHGCISVWLESTFDHCWRNIRFSPKERPLAKNKGQARELFEERARVYCLSDWHFVIDPGDNSFEIARQIAEEVFSIEVPSGR